MSFVLERNVARGLPFEVDIKRSNRKTAVIYIRNGRADVRVPTRAPNYWVREFILERQHWIEQQLKTEKQRTAERYSLEAGSNITYLGEALTVCALASGESIHISDGNIWLPQSDLFFDGSKAFHKWLKARAEEYIMPLSHELAERANVSERLTEVRFRNTKSRWGHCTGEGVVQFNWLIMLAPPASVHYLVAHEICHLAHMNHSRAFWSLVDQLCPQRKSAQTWLRANEHKLIALR